MEAFLHLNDQERSVLAEFIKKYHTQQWLRGANIIHNHPQKMGTTLEVHVNYKPLYEMQDLLSFTAKNNLLLHIVDMSSQ